MSWQQITDPTAPPVGLDQAKEHLKVTYEDEDYLIQLLIDGATEHAESVTRRAIMPRDFILYLDQFPNTPSIEIPRPNLQSVASVKYYDADNAEQTFASAKYFVDAVTAPGCVRLAPYEIWPDTYERPNAVFIEYTAGYADITDVPDGLKIAILLMVGHWFENREAVVIGPTGLRIKEVPMSAGFLLDQYRVMDFF